VLAKVCKHPRASKVATKLESADDDATDALDQFADFEWHNAVLKAKSCYDKVMAAAADLRIKIEPQAPAADRKSKGRAAHFNNPVIYRNFRGKVK
jgi:hypothetical protein